MHRPSEAVGDTELTYAFIVFYRYRTMSMEEAEKAREFWTDFLKGEWPSDVRIVGNYKYAWGTEWNGFLLIETESAHTFFEFWPKFRDKTRWYVDNTRTIIGQKT